MLDANLIAQMVEQELRSTVKEQVQQAVGQIAWIEDLEKQIIEFVQARIYAKFSNIGTLPDLVTAVETSVVRMFEQGFVPELESYVDSVKIKQTVDLAVEKFVGDTIENLAVDKIWTSKIENLIEQRMTDRVIGQLRNINLKSTLQNIVIENQPALLDALRKDFQTYGIKDLSSKTQLTILDGVVVVENEAVINDLIVERNTHLKGDLLLDGDLAVKGRINTDNRAWQELSNQIGIIAYNKFKQTFADELVDTVIDSVKAGVDINNVSVNGELLVSGNQLSNGIKISSLTQVGELESLKVKGSATIGDILSVNNQRVGINTDTPESALSIWDEEVSMSAGKLSKNTAFIGTARTQKLVLGTNRQSQLEIDTDGLVSVQKIKIGRNMISWNKGVPNFSGSKGDIVFNLDMTPDTPFAWICLGAFRWQALKTVQ